MKVRKVYNALRTSKRAYYKDVIVLTEVDRKIMEDFIGRKEIGRASCRERV